MRILLKKMEMLPVNTPIFLSTPNFWKKVGAYYIFEYRFSELFTVTNLIYSSQTWEIYAAPHGYSMSGEGTEKKWSVQSFLKSFGVITFQTFIYVYVFAMRFKLSLNFSSKAYACRNLFMLLQLS